MQNSLFRRRLAVRACFDVLCEHESSVEASPTTTINTPLLTTRSTIPFSTVNRVILSSNLPKMHKDELIKVDFLKF